MRRVSGCHCTGRELLAERRGLTWAARTVNRINRQGEGAESLGKSCLHPLHCLIKKPTHQSRGGGGGGDAAESTESDRKKSGGWNR